MKKVLREFYGEKPEESKDYCRIGEAKLSRKGPSSCKSSMSLCKNLHKRNPHVVSSRHLDRLKGLLAKTSGTVAIGGRSDEETRFIPSL